MTKEKESEFNYQKETAEDLVNKAKSQLQTQGFCKKCGKVTRHIGLKCRRCE